MGNMKKGRWKRDEMKSNEYFVVGMGEGKESQFFQEIPKVNLKNTGKGKTQ